MTTTAPPWMKWTGWILSALLSALFLMSAFFKLTLADPVVEGMHTKGGYPLEVIRPIGVVEVLCVLLFLIPRTAIFGTALLTAYMGGAVATHVHGGELWVPQVVIGVLVWVAYCLRKPEVLRAALS